MFLSINEIDNQNNVSVDTMKREGLRRRLALATLEILVPHHALTPPNVRRYVIPHLSEWNIRRSTKITDQDIRIALVLIYQAARTNPPSFRLAPGGSLWTQKRIEYFLRAPLTDLITTT